MLSKERCCGWLVFVGCEPILWDLSEALFFSKWAQHFSGNFDGGRDSLSWLETPYPVLRFTWRGKLKPPSRDAQHLDTKNW
ncbi:hypothetical protein L873DRAFT_1801010 [Choiromyces venosus 120613-1]|uniref:Uncharacterized protein n=1 Tax=Choiromyces venosus 120613-1 TaxID=1336337 RepID=A0A3N4JYD5_9PEZI|nr:hypothetical protein L873DRAFT_1801010 [Choiromyces venosus 120613-1]